MSWDFLNGDVDPYFRGLTEEALARWKVHYERLLKESSCKHMYEAWQRGLDMVDKEIKERATRSEEAKKKRPGPVQTPLF